MDSLGNIFIKYAQRNDFTVHIDTNYHVYDWWDWGDGALWYKLDAQLGERWLVWPHGVGVSDTVYATLIDIYEGYIFNNVPTTFKVIDYWLWYAPDSFWIQTRTIAAGFGLVQNFVEGGSLYYLAGAIIDSIPYGWLNPIDEPGEPELTSFELYQNYPNPFNPTTNIRFRIPQRGRSDFGLVNLSVYDVLGKLISTLVNKKLPPGSYTVQWDGKDRFGNDVASGVYLYRLRHNRQVLTRKMMLLR